MNAANYMNYYYSVSIAKKLVELIVFILVQLTRVACFPSTAVFTAFCDG